MAVGQAMPPLDAATEKAGLVNDDQCMSPKPKAVHPSEKGVISPDPKRLRPRGDSQGHGLF